MHKTQPESRPNQLHPKLVITQSQGILSEASASFYLQCLRGGSTITLFNTQLLWKGLPLNITLIKGKLCQRTKHSAASSIKPSWKRCSSLKVSARALRRLSEGSTRSLLCWNWLNILWERKTMISYYPENSGDVPSPNYNSWPISTFSRQLL